MNPYISQPLRTLKFSNSEVASFIADGMNADTRTVDSFGEEWNRFSSFTEAEMKRAGEQYFDIVTEEMINRSSTVLDIGCGTGRWSKFLSPRVAFIEAVDPGDAVIAAAEFTSSCANIRVTQAGFGALPFEKNSFDFVMSLGVVHHLPDTKGAVKEAASMVKKGGWLLLYIYYALDNRGMFYRFLFSISGFFRMIISACPRRLKFFLCDMIAIFIYLPFILLAKFIGLFSEHAKKRMPLSYYCDKPWKVIRNDSLDRFGTPLEKRFTKREIEQMLVDAGMSFIRFSDNEPYWHVVAQK